MLSRNLRVLGVEDSDDDWALIERYLRRVGYQLTIKRVDTIEAAARELRNGLWDVLLCDYALIGFTAPAVLEVANQVGTEVPILIVSDTIGEETAADLMRAGARDFIRKSNLARLAAAIERERQEFADRHERLAAEAARAAAEEETRKTRRLHQLVINSAPIFLYAVDSNGIFTLSEGRGLEPFRQQSGGMVGRKVLELYGNVDGVADHLRRVLGGEKHEVDITLGSNTYHLISIPALDAGGTVDGLSGVAIDVTERNKRDEQLRSTIAELARVADERRRLLRSLVNAQEQERQRIAGDLHDDTIQVITAVGFRIGAVRRQLAGTPQGELLGSLEVEISNAIKRTRSMLFELHPQSLESAGLAAALEEYLEKISADGGPATELHGSLAEEPPAESRAILFRVAQEALANVRKHANAKKVTVTLSSIKRGVMVRVEDDGVGFDPRAAGSELGHIGLKAMQERVRLGHGSLRVESAPNEGTSVEFWLPSAANDRVA